MKQRMRLYDILVDRIAVNMLKILYDQEYVSKTAHTMPFFRLNALLDGRLTLDIVLKIESAGLIAAEKVEEMFIISLNQKGKEFIEQLDVLRRLVEAPAENKKAKAFKIEYDLAPVDQRLLVLCYKMQHEVGGSVSLEALASEMYPKNSAAKKCVVSRYLNKLIKMNLLKKDVVSKEAMFSVSSSGERVIKDQLMEVLV